jgi:Secretion system C-terminal sorting domain
LVLKKSRIPDLIYGIMRTSTSLTLNEKNLIPQKFGLSSIPINENYMNVSYPNLEIPEAQVATSIELTMPEVRRYGFEISRRTWPNPASEFIQIQIENPNLEPCEIMILDGFGMEVLRSKLDVLQTEVLVDTKEIPVGRYFVKIIGGTPFETVSFLKN